MDVHEACLVLELRPDAATPDAVRKAYKRLALRHHPDKNLGREEEARETFQRISAAYAALQHPVGDGGASGHRRGSAETPDGGDGGSCRSDGYRSHEEWSWEEARDLFRDTFGMEFDEAAMAGAAAAAVVASEFVRVGAAIASVLVSAASLRASEWPASEWVTSNDLAVRRASRRVASDERAVRSALERVAQAEKSLRRAAERHENAVRANDRYVPGPAQRVEYRCGGTVGSVLSAGICVALTSDPIFFMACFFLIFGGLHLISFQGETPASLRARVALAGAVAEAGMFFEAQRLDLAVAQQALAQAHKELSWARRDLAEAQSPANQCLNIVSALFGIKNPQQIQTTEHVISSIFYP
mmetsp:Transcript_50190/g.98221  ORF Transcript_50190/g.98221 Transcript_50190/m.98221 type:complete len:357 (-) Transcript_50190:110-1180(-)